MATLAPSQAAEALLSRARRLSSHAYERSRTPTTFAEGEDVIVVPPSPKSPSSPGFAPIATLSTASLHQLHRNSFNEHVRDHGRRRSSHQKGSSSPSLTPMTMQGNNSAGATTVSADQQPSLLGEYPSSQFHHHQSDKNHTTNKYKNGSFTSAQTEGLSACPTNNPHSTMTRHSLTIITHPTAALTLESSREGSKTKHNDNVGSHYASSGGGHNDHVPYYADTLVHRKHRSENGTGGKLVLGILEALRDGDQHPSHGVSAPSGPSTPPRTLTPATGGALASQEPSNITLRTRADFKAKARPVSFAASLQMNRTNASAPSTTTFPTMQDAYTPVSTTATVTLPRAPTATAAIASPEMARPSARRDHNAPVPPPKSPVDWESSIRRGSHTGSIYSDISSVADNTSILSSPTLTSTTTTTTTSTATTINATTTTTTATTINAATANAASTTKGSSARSSKLFGRFVPKFLHSSSSSSSSSGPSTTADNSSLRSANSPSLSPLSTAATANSGRSANLAGGPSSPIEALGLTAMTKKTGTLPALPDALPSLPDVPWSSLEFHEDWLTDAVHSRNIHTTAATAAVGAERDNGVAHPTLLNRITSSSSRTSRRSIRSVQSTRSGHSEDAMTFEGSESITPIVEEQRPISDCNVEAQYEEEEEERWPTASDYPVEIQYKEEAKEQEFAQDQDRKEEEEEERYPEHDGSGPLLSPYIIDESCDDDFFLNSVLRKKSKPQPLSLVSTSTGAGARLGAGGWPSSAGRTPSLTNSIFTSSSQTSSATPSPTTPMFASSHSQNHGSSAPIMIHAGLDEKRTRLSDAVKEWRRSTNMSSGYIDSLTQPNFAV